jgi:hypothetical protein
MPQLTAIKSKFTNTEIPFWHYFISLEKDFAESLQFVELDNANGNTFSIVYAKLLFSACAEVEVVLKELCNRIAPNGKYLNINDYRTTVLGGFSSFHKIEVQLPRYRLTIRPWAAWESGKNPEWWHGYTSVKHNRGIAFQKANQKNVTEAMAGLFAALLYFYQSEIKLGNFDPEPQLFYYRSMFPGHLILRDQLVCRHENQVFRRLFSLTKHILQGAFELAQYRIQTPQCDGLFTPLQSKDRGWWQAHLLGKLSERHLSPLLSQEFCQLSVQS